MDFNLTDFINIALLIVTIGTVYIASLQYRASQAPIMRVIKTKYKISREPKNEGYTVIVKNIGNGLCLDTFLLIQEKKEKKTNYHISKPKREIEPGNTHEFIIQSNIRNIKESKYMVIYMDYFGRKYLASDVLKEVITAENSDKKHTNEHLERFSKPAKQLIFWTPKKWIYKYWMKQAIRQGNTPGTIHEKQIQELHKAFENFDIDKHFTPNDK